MRTHVLDAFARDWLARWRDAGGLAYADPTSSGRGYVLTADSIQQARQRHLLGMLHGTVGAQAGLSRILSAENAPTNRRGRAITIHNMSMDTTASDTFDPDQWLGDWSDNGGLAMLVQGRLYLGRAKALDRRGNLHLDQLRSQLIRSGAWDAVTEALRHDMLVEAE